MPCKSENNKYQHLKAIGFNPKGVACLAKGSALNILPDPLFEEARNYFDFPFIDEHASMRGVKSTRSNVEKSLAKCDARPTYPSDPLQTMVEDMVFTYLKPELSVGVLRPQDDVYIKNASSPGKKWKQKKCKTKGEALSHPDFPSEFRSLTSDPVMDYNGKTELLEVEEIVVEDKIRGTFNPPIDFIMKQKLIFDRQNASIAAASKKKWIRYGFVKQYGGFHKFCSDMEQFHIIDEDDCKGYDRLIYLMKVYELRWRGFSKFSPGFMLTFWYCAWFSIFNLVLCPDGVVRQRQTGNGSGSNNTTADNSIFHLLVVFRFIFKLWKRYQGRYPTLSEVLDNHRYNIYSDDAVGGHNISLFPDLTLDEFYSMKVSTYLEFGLILKPAQHYLTVRPDLGRISPKHSFLGSYFYYDEKLRFYVPYPRVEKIS